MTDAEYALSEIANLATLVLEDTTQTEATRRAAGRIRDEAIRALLDLEVKPMEDAA